MTYNEAEFLFQTPVPDGLIVSRTDLKGVITYANDILAEISGYSQEELVGKPHSILRHPDMPSSVFKEMWETIQSKKQWKGVVKNIRKDKGFYWVKAVISGVYEGEEMIGYKSLRFYVEQSECIKAQKQYDKMNTKKREITYK